MLLKCRPQMVDSLLRPQWVIVISSDIRVYVRDYGNPPSSSLYGSVELYVCLPWCDIGTIGLSRRLSRRWWGAGGCQFDSYRCCSQSPDSRRWGLSVQTGYFPCHYYLPCFAYILHMPLRHQLRALDIPLKGLYLYLWLYVTLASPLVNISQ